MKSIRHVFWRAALALGLVATGLGSGIGLPPAVDTAAAEACTAPRPANALASDGSIALRQASISPSASAS